MMSQNRASTRDRLKADVDHQVNLNSERGVGKLLKKIDKLEEKVNKLCAEAELARKSRESGAKDVH